ncbi:MAG TPA: CaiB/BaiF CoA-transferase family protein [Cyclobacteriaceae bacterium]
MQNRELFKCLKVVELASVLAGPSVGQFFAELGSEVIKVENSNTGGDVTRGWYTTHESGEKLSAYFCSVNWGKKSIDLDLNNQVDREIVHKLVAESDIVIASYKLGDDAKLGVDYETLKSINERIIYGQISGYGSGNPKVGYDAVIQAESGFMDLNGEKGGSPLKMPVALIDVLAGHQLKEGILVALLERMQTGKGQFIEVSLIQTALSSLANQAANWLYAGNVPVRQGSLHPNIAPYGETFETQDKKLILLAIGSDAQFKKLCKLLVIEEIATQAEFANNKARVKNRTRLKAFLKTQFEKHQSDDLMSKFSLNNIPAGLILNVAEAFDMKEAKQLLMQAAGYVGVRTYIAEGKLNTNKDLSPPPQLGQHKEEILAALKL